MVDLSGLKRLTKELAEEVEYDEKGPALRFIELILDNIHSMAGILDKDCNVVFINKSAIDYCKMNNIDFTDKGICPMKLSKEYCKNCPVKDTIKSRTVESVKYISPVTGRCISYTCIPLIFNGVSGVIALINGKLKDAYK